MNTAIIEAQKYGLQIDWRVGACLPADVANTKPLGVAGAMAGVHGGVLIVGGGANFPGAMPWMGGQKTYSSKVYVYALKGQKLWKLNTEFNLPFATAYGASCSTPKGVVYVGGESGQGIDDKVLLVKWDSDAQKIEIDYLPSFPFKVTNAAIACSENLVYVAGGETLDGGVSAAMFAIDLNQLSGGWKQLPNLPAPVSHAVMVANENKVYLVGGRKRNVNSISTIYANTNVFDVKENVWTPLPSLPYPLSAASGIITADEKILVFSGDKGKTFNETEALIAAINSEQNLKKKEELVAQKAVLQNNHPGFSKAVLMFSTKTNSWVEVGAIPCDAPVTTTAICWGENVILPSGEIKAGVRTPQILIGKIKKRLK